jgi:hypothetical protein
LSILLPSCNLLLDYSSSSSFTGTVTGTSVLQVLNWANTDAASCITFSDAVIQVNVAKVDPTDTIASQMMRISNLNMETHTFRFERNI